MKYKHLKWSIVKSETSNKINICKIKDDYNATHNVYRKLVRETKAVESIKRDEKLHLILSKDPSKVHKSIRASKRSNASKINKLTVGDKTYFGDNVQDGFYDSISHLKTRDLTSLESSTDFFEFSNDYQNILELCKQNLTIPTISENQAFELLHRMKSSVTNLYRISVNHYK